MEGGNGEELENNKFTKQKDKIKGQRPAAKELLVTPEVGVGDTQEGANMATLWVPLRRPFSRRAHRFTSDSQQRDSENGLCGDSSVANWTSCESVQRSFAERFVCVCVCVCVCR